MRHVIETIVQTRLSQQREALLSFFDYDPSDDVTDALPHIRTPTLVTHGSEDRLVPSKPPNSRPVFCHKPYSTHFQRRDIYRSSRPHVSSAKCYAGLFIREVFLASAEAVKFGRSSKGWTSRSMTALARLCPSEPGLNTAAAQASGGGSARPRGLVRTLVPCLAYQNRTWWARRSRPMGMSDQDPIDSHIRSPNQ
jgi:hypothetical protein